MVLVSATTAKSWQLASDVFVPYLEVAHSHGGITGFRCGPGCPEPGSFDVLNRHVVTRLNLTSIEQAV